MTPVEADARSPKRRASDEEIAAEGPLPALELPAGAVPSAVEAHLGNHRKKPLALAGVVENGVVKLVDPGVKLPERSRVIVVAEGM